MTSTRAATSPPDAPSSPTPPNSPGRSRQMLDRARPEWVINNILLGALVVMIAYFTTQSDAFLTLNNAKLILENNATLGVVVVGVAALVISGGVDLSIGSTVGLSGLVTGLALAQWGLPGPVAVLLGVLAGAAVGAVNGVLCGILRLNPVIVTLGMLGAVRGATLLLYDEQVFGLESTVAWIGSTSLLGVSVSTLVALGVFVIGGVVLARTTWGRQIYAIGANFEAARLSALPVRAIPFMTYLFCGIGAGVAGVLLAARLRGVAPGQQGLNLELQALTVVLLGGVAFSGGRGRLFGVFTGWIFLGVLDNGLILTNISPFVKTLVLGLALIAAAALDRFSTSLTDRVGRRRRIAAQLGAPPPSSASTT